MYDNKIRLSNDVLEKAQLIASEWGLKNVRAAVEAVFRRYADEYLSGQAPIRTINSGVATKLPAATNPLPSPTHHCEALNELDDLLGL